MDTNLSCSLKSEDIQKSEIQLPVNKDISWRERTEVITKLDHENYKQFSKDILEDVIEKAVVTSSDKISQNQNGNIVHEICTVKGEKNVLNYESNQEENKENICNYHVNTKNKGNLETSNLNRNPLQNIDKEIRGALDLLKSFENLGISSPNSSRVSLERAKLRSSKDTYNPFSTRTSFGSPMKVNETLQKTFDDQTKKLEQLLLDNCQPPNPNTKLSLELLNTTADEVVQDAVSSSCSIKEICTSESIAGTDNENISILGVNDQSINSSSNKLSETYESELVCSTQFIKSDITEVTQISEGFNKTYEGEPNECDSDSKFPDVKNYEKELVSSCEDFNKQFDDNDCQLADISKIRCTDESESETSKNENSKFSENDAESINDKLLDPQKTSVNGTNCVDSLVLIEAEGCKALVQPDNPPKKEFDLEKKKLEEMHSPHHVNTASALSNPSNDIEMDEFFDCYSNENQLELEETQKTLNVDQNAVVHPIENVIIADSEEPISKISHDFSSEKEIKSFEEKSVPDTDDLKCCGENEVTPKSKASLVSEDLGENEIKSNPTSANINEDRCEVEMEIKESEAKLLTQPQPDQSVEDSSQGIQSNEPICSTDNVNNQKFCNPELNLNLPVKEEKSLNKNEMEKIPNIDKLPSEAKYLNNPEELSGLDQSSLAKENILEDISENLSNKSTLISTSCDQKSKEQECFLKTVADITNSPHHSQSLNATFDGKMQDQAIANESENTANPGEVSPEMDKPEELVLKVSYSLNNLDDIIDPFKTKVSIKNTPPKQQIYSTEESISQDTSKNLNTTCTLNENCYETNLKVLEAPLEAKSDIPNSPPQLLNKTVNSDILIDQVSANELESTTSKGEVFSELENQDKPEEPISKGSYNLDNLDEGFDPFKTKSSITNTPPKQICGTEEESISKNTSEDIKCPNKLCSIYCETSSKEQENSLSAASGVINLPSQGQLLNKTWEGNDMDNLENQEVKEMTHTAVPDNISPKMENLGKLRESVPRGSYELDNFDENIDPFATKASVRNTPPKEIDSIKERSMKLEEVSTDLSNSVTLPSAPHQPGSPDHSTLKFNKTFDGDVTIDLNDQVKSNSQSITDGSDQVKQDLYGSSREDSVMDEMQKESAGSPKSSLTKGNYNLDFLDNESINPFKTKSVVANSPPIAGNKDSEKMSLKLADQTSNDLELSQKEKCLMSNDSERLSLLSSGNSEDICKMHSPAKEDISKANLDSPSKSSEEKFQGAIDVTPHIDKDAAHKELEYKEEEGNETVHKDEGSETLLPNVSSKGSYNLDFLDDEIANPFETKSAIQNSPPSSAKKTTEAMLAKTSAILSPNEEDTLASISHSNGSKSQSASYLMKSEDGVSEDDSNMKCNLTRSDSSLLTCSEGKAASCTNTVEGNNSSECNTISVSEESMMKNKACIDKGDKEALEPLRSDINKSVSNNVALNDDWGSDKKDIGGDDDFREPEQCDDIFSEKAADILDRDEITTINIDSVRNIRKSISSLEFDEIAKQALELTKEVTPGTIKTTTTTDNSPKTNKSFEEFCNGSQSNPDNDNDDKFCDSVLIFSNEEELDILGCHGNTSFKVDLARNSLFVKFDPLIAADMDNNEEGNARRGSSLISFSPYKKAEKTTSPPPQPPMSRPIKADLTFNDTTLVDESFLTDANTTVLIRTSSDIPFGLCAEATTQTEEKMIPVQEHEATLKKQEIVFQDGMLRKLREFEEMKNALRAEFEAKTSEIEALKEEGSRMRKLVNHFHDLMGKIIEKKNSVEKEFVQQISDMKASHKEEVDKMALELSQQQEELASSEKSVYEFVMKQERLRQIVVSLKNNVSVLEEENADLKNTLAEKQASFKSILCDLEQKMRDAEEWQNNETKKHENEMNKNKLLLKRAEMKIISLMDAVQKKEAENKMLSDLLDDCSQKFSS